MVARLEPTSLHPEAELTAFLAELDGEGAIASFVGMTRSKDRDGLAVASLFLDHYPGMTEASLAAIAADARTRFAIDHTRIVHRCGLVKAGEPIVFVAAAAAHRREAFLAADYLMDRLKTDAVFWKREDGAEGSQWIEPSTRDRTDRARWD
jgi:molybdopterin synthase catalytic subunit